MAHTYPAGRGSTAIQALDGVDLHVAPGQMLGLLGPNGCGKTTLMSALAGLLPPDRGEVRVFGTDPVTDPLAVRRHLGVVFQQPALDVQLSVIENLVCHGRLYGMTKSAISERANPLLATLGLENRTTSRVATLSGGQRRRVELARALLPSPRLLLMDEPTTGLDPRGREEFWQLLSQLRAESPLTILVSTHLMD
ncbi:MAG: ABC transporter ATP-binding protein, partial [Phycisphaeraceae bacterium]|nr:ABC transporter ATP-binding protein [Phycisphaeraceae bacterium]